MQNIKMILVEVGGQATTNGTKIGGQATTNGTKVGGQATTNGTKIGGQASTNGTLHQHTRSCWSPDQQHMVTK